MQFSEIRTRLIDVYGGKLNSDTDLYNRCINDAYHEICAFTQWWWLETYTALTFSAPVSQGVAYDCTEGATAIAPSTAAGALSTAYINGWVATDDYTYRITDVTTASPYTVTIGFAFIETTTAYSVNVWNDTLTLPDDFDQAIAMAPMLDQDVQPLAHVPFEELEAQGPDVSDQYVDIAQVYSIYRETSITTNFRVRIWPPPDTEITYVFRYRAFPTDMSADTAVPLIPAKHHSVLVSAARHKLMVVTGQDRQEVDYWQQQTLQGLDRMVRDSMRRGKVKRRFGTYGTVITQDLPWRLTNYTEGVDCT